jgi:hypothetical protein
MIRPTTLCLTLFLAAATGTSLAAPASAWTSSDIGGPALPGSGIHTGNGWNLTAGGTDIWGTADQFHYAYEQRTGDFDVAVRTLEFKPAHLYSKVGLMARESLTANSRHIYFMAFADNKPRNKNNGGFEFQFREVAGGASKAIYPVIKPDTPAEFPVAYPDVWLRLQRRGHEFSAFASADGKNWKPYARYTLELPPTVFLGVALTAHNAKATATAVCSDVVDVK